MSTMASQITSLMTVYSAVYSGTDQRKHQSSASLGLCEANSPVTGEFQTERASNAENVSIWWRHNVDGLIQKRRNSIARALELRLFCIKPLI